MWLEFLYSTQIRFHVFFIADVKWDTSLFRNNSFKTISFYSLASFIHLFIYFAIKPSERQNSNNNAPKQPLPFSFLFPTLQVKRLESCPPELSLREKCPYLKLFWSVFSRIWTEYVEILLISPFSVRMRGYTEQNNYECGHILHTVYDSP